MQAGPNEIPLSNHEGGEDFETRVRNLAYELWQKEGEPEGREDEFWLRAEARVRAEAIPEPPLADAAPDDAHDEAVAQSFPASDPPAPTSKEREMAAD